MRTPETHIRPVVKAFDDAKNAVRGVEHDALVVQARPLCIVNDNRPVAARRNLEVGRSGRFSGARKDQQAARLGADLEGAVVAPAISGIGAVQSEVQLGPWRGFEMNQPHVPSRFNLVADFQVGEPPYGRRTFVLAGCVFDPEVEGSFRGDEVVEVADRLHPGDIPGLTSR